MKSNIYLYFNGQCEAAFKFYEQCLGGKITSMMTYGDSPMAERGGVFEFSQPIDWALAPEGSQNPEEPQDQYLPTADPADLQQQIDDLLAQDPDSPLIASLYNSLGQAYERQFRYTDAEVAYCNAAQRREQ